MTTNDSLVYWDSCVLIDRLEGKNQARIEMLRAMTDAAERGDLQIVTSALALTEVVKLNNLTELDVHLTPKDRLIRYKDIWDVPLRIEHPKWSWQKAFEPTQPETQEQDNVKTKQVAAPAAMPDPTAQNVSETEPIKASDLQSIPASSVEPAQNLKQPSSETNANQNQPDQTSEESNQIEPGNRSYQGRRSLNESTIKAYLNLT